MTLVKEQLEKEKLEEMRRVVNTITSYMVLPMYLIFWITDLVYAPQFKWEFLLLRLLVIPLALLSNVLVNQATTLLSAQNIALAYIFGLSIIIDVMIFMIGDPISPYYTGLLLVATGGLGFFPWSRKYFIYVVLVIFVPYVLIILSLSPNENDFATLVVIGFFINGSVTVLWLIQIFRENLRVKEVTVRINLNLEIEKRKSAENDLILARDQALQASQAKSEFLANMSHELRTPLTAIIGYSELLQDVAYDGDKNEYIEDLKKIDSAGKSLLDLINGVLDISKIEAGQMEVSVDEFSLHHLLNNVEAILLPVFEKSNNKFNIEYPKNIGSLISDEIKLRQVIYNLASNAGKFTKDGKILLSISAIQIHSQDWLRFDMSDTGIGMTAEQEAIVFNAFTQADSSTTKKYGGTGLGLSICKHFCQMLGGDIFLKSKEGYGSTFTVLIPRKISNINNESEEKVDSAELEKIVFADNKEKNS